MARSQAPYWKRIDKLNIDNEAKEGYKWLLANYEAVKKETANAKTIGDFRQKCFKLIGFAPAIIDCFFKGKDREKYLEALEDNHK
ncbi:MAG: hypothetical protein ACOC5T_03455 [Elusimicrobiota bacterium]